jgi:hypothetical protein
MKKLQIKTLGDRIGGRSQDWGNVDDGGTSPCKKTNCITYCLTTAQCCCDYECPSGKSTVCTQGYCPNTYTSCQPW